MTANKCHKEEIMTLKEAIQKDGQRHLYVKSTIALFIALGKPDLGDQCRLYKRFGGVQTAVVRLTEADARSLLGLSRLRVGWVNCLGRRKEAQNLLMQTARERHSF